LPVTRYRKEQETSETLDMVGTLSASSSGGSPFYVGRGIGANGGGMPLATIYTNNNNSATIGLFSLAEHSVQTTSKFRAKLQAYKLSD